LFEHRDGLTNSGCVGDGIAAFLSKFLDGCATSPKQFDGSDRMPLTSSAVAKTKQHGMAELLGDVRGGHGTEKKPFEFPLDVAVLEVLDLIRKELAVRLGDLSGSRVGRMRQG